MIFYKYCGNVIQMNGSSFVRFYFNQLILVCVCFRPYVVNLLPCLLRICQRSEEMVHETLAAAMSKISPVLISFMTDMETKVIISYYCNLWLLVPLTSPFSACSDAVCWFVGCGFSKTINCLVLYKLFLKNC